MIEKNAEKQEKPQEQRDTDQEYEKNAVDMQGFVGMRNTLDIKQKKEAGNRQGNIPDVLNVQTFDQVGKFFAERKRKNQLPSGSSDWDGSALPLPLHWHRPVRK